MKFLVLIGFFFSLNLAFSQLDSKYLGEYITDDISEVLTLYTMDEMDEHCFFVEYALYDEEENLVKSLEGYGHCDDSEGMKAFFYFDEFKEPLVALLTTDEFGDIEMDVQFPDRSGTTNFYQILNTDAEYEDDMYETPSEVTFIRDDQAQLILFDDNRQIGFRIIGAKSTDCLVNDYVGVLLPIDEEMKILEYSDGKGCVMKMQIAEVGVTVTETNCSKLHAKSCSSWNGLYKFP